MLIWFIFVLWRGGTRFWIYFKWSTLMTGMNETPQQSQICCIVYHILTAIACMNSVFLQSNCRFVPSTQKSLKKTKRHGQEIRVTPLNKIVWIWGCYCAHQMYSITRSLHIPDADHLPLCFFGIKASLCTTQRHCTPVRQWVSHPLYTMAVAGSTLKRCGRVFSACSTRWTRVFFLIKLHSCSFPSCWKDDVTPPEHRVITLWHLSRMGSLCHCPYFQVARFLQVCCE